LIKFILNGSFRSGTTLVWKIMRESNPGMYVFCEPLHNNLFKEIYREQVLKQYGHGFSTTSEYLQVGDEFLKHLRQFHPVIGNEVYTFKIDDVTRYLKIYDSLDKPVILQPNRMHFIISDIAHAFNCKVAHIIRHPLDIFLSVMFSSPKLKYLRKLLGINPYLFRLIRNPNPYFLDEQFEFMLRYFGVGQMWKVAYDKYFLPKHYYLQRFIICWTISNWYAVNEIDKANGLIARYEDIVSGENTLQRLENYSGVRFDPKKVNIHKKSIAKYKKGDIELCFNLAERMGIGEEFRNIMERFDYGF